jgi:hypothetical protein
MEKNQVVENCHSTFPSSIKIFNKNFSPKQKVPPLTAPPWMVVSKIINKFCNLHQNSFIGKNANMVDGGNEKSSKFAEVFY